MSDYIYKDNEHKEIKISQEVKKDEYAALQEENFKEQHKRKEKVDLYSKKNVQDTDVDAIMADLESMEKELEEKLEEKREDVKEQMPPELSEEQKEINAMLKIIHDPLPSLDEKNLKEIDYKKRKVKKFPKSLRKVLEEVSQWTELNAKTSEPVKTQAVKLLEAENEADAAAALGLLINRSARYLAIRGEQWHIPGGQGIKRVNAVKSLIKELFTYAADQSVVYLENVDVAVEALVKTDDRKANDLRGKYIKDGLDIFKNKIGLTETDTLEEYKDAKKQVDTIHQNEADKITDVVDYAKKTLEFRDSIEYDMHSKRIFVEEDNIEAEDVIRQVEYLDIPDVSSMDDKEILSYPYIEYLRYDVYFPAVQKLDRMVAFGHITDVDTIQKLKAKMRAFDMAMNLYDARLKAIAQVDGADKAYEEMDGYGLTVEDLTEKCLNDIKTEEAERYRKFKPLYRRLYGKDASKKELAKRRLIFEQGLSKKEYFNRGLKAAFNSIDINKKAFPNEEKVSFSRAVYPLIGYSLEKLPPDDELVKELGLSEHDGFINNPEMMKKVIGGLCSKNKDEWKKAMKRLIKNAMSLDLSMFSDTSSEEALFRNTILKQYLLQGLSQFKKFVDEELIAKGYELTKDERDLLKSYGALGETLNATIGFTQDMLKEEGTEMFPLEEILSLDKEKRDMVFEPSDNEDDYELAELKNILGKYETMMPGVFVTFTVNSNLEELKERSLAEIKYGDIVSLLGEAHSNRNLYEKNGYEPEIPLKHKKKRDDKALDEAIKLMKGSMVPKISDMPRATPVASIGLYVKGKMQIDEIEGYVKKFKIKLTEEEQKVIDKYKADYEKYMPYYMAFNDLITSKGFVPLVNKGLGLDLSQIPVPASTEKLNIIKSRIKTKDEAETFEKWLKLRDMWMEYIKDDDTAVSNLSEKLFFQGTKKARNELENGMTSAQKIECEHEPYQIYEENLSAYMKEQAKKEMIAIGNEKEDLAIVSNYSMLKGISVKDSYDLYKHIGLKENDATNEQLQKKSKYTEEIFDEIMSWDLNEFSFRTKDDDPQNLKDISDNFMSKYMKLKVASQMESVISEYKSFVIRDRVKDLKYDKDMIEKLQIRVEHLSNAFLAYQAVYLEAAGVKVNVSGTSYEAFKESGKVEDAVPAVVQEIKEKKAKDAFKKRKKLSEKTGFVPHEKVKKSMEEEEARKAKEAEEAKKGKNAKKDAGIKASEKTEEIKEEKKEWSPSKLNDIDEESDSGMSPIEEKYDAQLEEFYEENDELLAPLRDQLAELKTVSAGYNQRLQDMQKARADRMEIDALKKEKYAKESELRKILKEDARDLGIFSYAEDVDYKELKVEDYTEEKKAQYEEVLRDHGCLVGRSRAGNNYFRSEYMYNEELAQEYVWRPGVAEEVKEAYQWLGRYYIVHDDTMDFNVKEEMPEKLKIPKYNITLPDADQIAREYELQTAGNNCFACAGAEMYRQYCRQEGILAGTVTQDSIRKFRPKFKEFEDYKDLVHSIDPGTEEQDFKSNQREVNGFLKGGRVGNIFELGDFFIGKQKDAILNKTVLYYPEATAGMTKQQKQIRKIKYNNMKAAFFEKVYEGLSSGHVVTVVTDHPMKHYTTIVGLEGNKVKFVDSLASRNGQVNTMDVEDFYLPNNEDGQVLELVWMTRRPKDGAIPQGYSNLVMNKDGELENKDIKIDEIMMVAQTKGINVTKPVKDMKLKVDGMKEAIYLSK